LTFHFHDENETCVVQLIYRYLWPALPSYIVLIKYDTIVVLFNYEEFI